MDEKIVQEILDELFPYLEAVEAQSAAVSQFLKEKGIASEEEFAPYVTRAENASSVRWRAARARVNYLLSGAVKPAEEIEEERPEQQLPEREKQKTEDTQTATEESQKKADPNPKTNEEDQESGKKGAAQKDPS